MKFISFEEIEWYACWLGFFSHQIDGRVVFWSLQCNRAEECEAFWVSGEGRKFARVKWFSHFTE